MMPETLVKVRQIREYALKNGKNIDIEVDGGLNAANVGMATEAGANVVVAGSAIFKAKKVRDVINKMREQARHNPFVSGR